MGKLTKAKFAASKKALGLTGKLTRKQVQRVFKHAIKKLGRSQSRSKKTETTTRKKNPKRRKTNLAKKKNRRQGKSIFKTAVKIAKAASIILPPIAAYQRYGNIADPVLIMTGYNMTNGAWEPRRLLQGWGPFVGLTVAEKIVAKVNGLIRSI